MRGRAARRAPTSPIPRNPGACSKSICVSTCAASTPSARESTSCRLMPASSCNASESFMSMEFSTPVMRGGAPGAGASGQKTDSLVAIWVCVCGGGGGPVEARGGRLVGGLVPGCQRPGAAGTTGGRGWAAGLQRSRADGVAAHAPWANHAGGRAAPPSSISVAHLLGVSRRHGDHADARLAAQQVRHDCAGARAARRTGAVS